MSLLDIEDVHIRFATNAGAKAFLPGYSRYLNVVCGVSLRILPHETFSLVGESGAGKTTLARAVVGLVKPHQGSIRFEGKEISRLPESRFKPVRREVAFMFQDPVGCLSPRITVGGLLAEPFKIHGIRKSDLKAEVRRLLSIVSLSPDFMGRYPHQLSGGQARRVGVARALALSPRLIIADEPTAGLDVSVQGEILNLMNRIQDEMGVGFLVITHNLSVVRHISHFMAIMYLGRFVEHGPTAEIFGHPRHPYTQALLSANPTPDPDAPKERHPA